MQATFAYFCISVKKFSQVMPTQFTTLISYEKAQKKELFQLFAMFVTGIMQIYIFEIK